MRYKFVLESEGKITIIDTIADELYVLDYGDIADNLKYFSHDVYEKVNLIKGNTVRQFKKDYITLNVSDLKVLDLRQVLPSKNSVVDFQGSNCTLKLGLIDNDETKLYFNTSDCILDLTECTGEIGYITVPSHNKVMFPIQQKVDVSIFDIDLYKTTMTGKIGHVDVLKITGSVSGYNALVKRIDSIGQLGEITLDSSEKNVVCNIPPQVKSFAGHYVFNLTNKEPTLTIDMQNLELHTYFNIELKLTGYTQGHSKDIHTITVFIKNLNCKSIDTFLSTIGKLIFLATKCKIDAKAEVPDHLKEKLGKNYFSLRYI